MPAISVYYIQYEPSATTPEQWLDELPPEAQARLSRKQPRDRWQSLAGLQMLKQGLQALGFSDYSLTELSFPQGHKPACGRAVDFNISHSGNLVACALSDATPIGLDIEKIRPMDAHSFRLYLTPAERHWASREPSRFFALWTGKESAAKAHGQGLDRVRHVQISANRASFAGKEWHLQPLDLAPGYRSTLATEATGPPTGLSIRELLPEHLIPGDA